MSDEFSEVIQTGIWEEIPEQDNPYAAAACYCSGYDVYGDLLGKAQYLEYLYLLFRGDRPEPSILAAFEVLAVAIANPGPRDPAVHAAMAAGVGGSTAASALMAALAVGAGSYGGAREVYLAMEAWQNHGTNYETWRAALEVPRQCGREQVWPDSERPPGFDPHGVRCAAPVLQTLKQMGHLMPNGCTSWLAKNRVAAEAATGRPLGMTGVVAAALHDMGFSPDEGEMLTLLLRLPGAAAHALEQGKQGFRKFPFFSLDLQNDPGPAPTSAKSEQS
jgi:citrate synthase